MSHSNPDTVFFTRHNVWESECVICKSYNVQVYAVATQKKVNRQLTGGHIFSGILADEGRRDPDTTIRYATCSSRTPDLWLLTS